MFPDKFTLEVTLADALKALEDLTVYKGAHIFLGYKCPLCQAAKRIIAKDDRQVVFVQEPNVLTIQEDIGLGSWHQYSGDETTGPMIRAFDALMRKIAFGELSIEEARMQLEVSSWPRTIHFTKIHIPS